MTLKLNNQELLEFRDRVRGGSLLDYAEFLRARDTYLAACPIPHADVIDMPKPGPDFVRFAEEVCAGAYCDATGNERPALVEMKGLRGAVRAAANATNMELLTVYQSQFLSQALEYAYVRALYEPGFQMPVIVKHKPVSVCYVSGNVRGTRVDRSDFWYGPPPAGDMRDTARVMVIGKFPGHDEVAEAENFVGPSSDEFFRACDAVGIDTRRDFGKWYLTSLVKHASPDPATSGLAKAWIANCAPLLFAELYAIRPTHVLCLGPNATSAVIKSGGDAIKLYGQVVECHRSVNRIKDSKATFSFAGVSAPLPAYVQHNPDAATDLQNALGLFWATVNGKTPTNTESDVRHVCIYTAKHLRQVVDSIIADASPGIGQPIAVDCEWHGDRPGEPGAYLRTVQFSHRPKVAYCVVLRGQGGVRAFMPDESQITIQLLRLLKSDKEHGGRVVRLGGHFLRADMPWLLSLGVDARDEFRVADTPRLTRTHGGWDTGSMGHAYQEAMEGGFKLENLAVRFCGVPRYDTKLLDWKARYCADRKLGIKQLDGYGQCPDDVLHPYAVYDVDSTIRLFYEFNGVGGKPGLLDRRMVFEDGTKKYADGYRAPSSREGFWISHSATLAALEMEMSGICVDRDRGDALTRLFMDACDVRTEEFRDLIGWNVPPGAIAAYPQGAVFNINSALQVRELLFGEALNGAQPMPGESFRRLRPKGALSLGLTPIKPAGNKLKKSWEQVLADGLEGVNPGVDKETLGILSYNTTPTDLIDADGNAQTVGDIVGKLRDIKFTGQVFKNTLRRPTQFGNAFLFDDDNNYVYDGGLLHWVGADGRVRTHFGLVETGRWSSWVPNLQNICLDGDTEILTRRGWVKFPSLLAEDRVAQYWPDTKVIDFVQPDGYTRQHFDGDMVHFETDKQIDLLMTPQHRCLVRDRRNGCWSETVATEIKEDFQHIHAGVYRGGTTSLSAAHVAWLCAVQAAGSYVPGGGIRFGFTTERKCERLTATLQTLDVPFTQDPRGIYVGISDPRGRTAYDFAKEWLADAKTFGPRILTMDRASLDCFVEELFHWDGLVTRKTEFSSRDKQSADWAQIAFSLSGVRARMREYDNGNANDRLHYCVDIPSRRVDYSMTTNRTLTPVPWAGKVYCVTVPSQFIVVRRNGKVSVTGNSKRRESDYERILGSRDPSHKYYRETGRYLYPLRSMLCAAPGHVLIEADYKMAEMAVIGKLAGDSGMLEMVRRNTLSEDDPDFVDLHSLTAIEAFRLDNAANRALLAAYNKKEGKTIAWAANKDVLKAIGCSSLRVAAKNVNFGVPYQRSAEAIARQCREEGADVSIEDAQKLIDAYHSRYPDISAYLDACMARVQSPGWMCGTFGRLRRFGRASEKSVIAEQQRQACNFPIQNGVADYISRACDAIYAYKQALTGDSLHSFRMCLQIHDALLFEVPYDSVVWFLDDVLVQCMRDAVAITPRDLDGRKLAGVVPLHLDIDAEVFTHWGERIDREHGLSVGLPEVTPGGFRVLPKPKKVV